VGLLGHTIIFRIVASSKHLVRWVHEYDAFAPIVRARPNPQLWPTFHQGLPQSLQPDTSPNPSDSISLRTNPCPPRNLVGQRALYPRLWIQRPSSDRRRDFKPPDSAACPRTLWPSADFWHSARGQGAPSRRPHSPNDTIRSLGVVPTACQKISHFPPDLSVLALMDIDLRHPARFGRPAALLLSGFCLGSRLCSLPPLFFRGPSRFRPCAFACFTSIMLHRGLSPPNCRHCRHTGRWRAGLPRGAADCARHP